MCYKSFRVDLVSNEIIVNYVEKDVELLTASYIDIYTHIILVLFISKNATIVMKNGRESIENEGEEKKSLIFTIFLIAYILNIHFFFSL